MKTVKMSMVAMMAVLAMVVFPQGICRLLRNKQVQMRRLIEM